MRVHLFVKLLLIAIFELNSCSPQSESSSIRLEPLGQVSIPHNYIFEETPIGGLSGLAYNSGSDIYYVISDDRSDLAGARFYSFTLTLSKEGRLEEGGISFQSMRYLRMADGQRYPKGRVDPEGIALAGDSLIYISSEGIPDKNIAPSIIAYQRDGKFVKSLALPDAYLLQKNSVGKGRGVRNNLGFEALAESPNGTKLYAGTESALVQDGPAADTANASPSRVIVFDTVTGEVMHEYCYMVDPVSMSSSDHSGFMVNGLTSLLVLDKEGQLLSLERNYVAGEGNIIRLYLINTEGATDIKGVPNLRQMENTLQPVSKEHIAYLSDFDITIDNFEGLVLGSELEEGGRLLLMVSDNNFSETQQTLFTAFRLHY